MRALPAAEVLLYTQNAEHYALEGGFDLYDIPAFQMDLDRDTFGRNTRVWEYTPSRRSSVDVTASLEPSIEAMRQINTVCPKPRMVYKDTLTTEYNFFGGSWESRYTFDVPRTKRLWQKSSTKNVVWRMESKYILPVNANIAFTMKRLPPKYDNNSTSYPAKLQVVISDTWQVRSSDNNDAGIWRKVSGQWRQELQLPLSGRNEEIVCWVMCRRGTICFSFDRGAKWYVARDEGGALTLPAGQVVMEGVSCQATFGFHQLAFDNCFYETFEIPTLEEHSGIPSVDLSQTLRPTGTSISLSILSSSIGTVKYRVSLNVVSFPSSGISFNLYRVPEVYATMLSWQTTLIPPVGTYTDLVAEGEVEEIDVQEDTDLDQRSGRLKLLRDVTEDLSGNFGYKVIGTRLGYRLDDDTYDLESRALFYLIQPEPQVTEDWDASFEFELVDLWYRATTTLVDEGWRPLDGMSCVAARNYVLLKMGLPSSRGSWLDTGKVLPSGLPDYPKWWPKPGMSASDVFKAIDIYEWTESFVANDGTYTSRPYRYTDAIVSFELDGGDPDTAPDPEMAVESIRYRAEHREVKTAFLGTAQDSRGGSIWATNINYALERNPSYPGFIGWRIWSRHENLEVGSLAEALVVLNAMRADSQNVPQLAEITIPGLHTIYRGMLISILNSGMVGITDDHRFRVEGLGFQWRPFKSQTKTNVRVRRVV